MEEKELEFPKSLIGIIVLLAATVLLVFFASQGITSDMLRLPDNSWIIKVNNRPISVEQYEREAGIERVRMVLAGADPAQFNPGSIIDGMITNKIIQNGADDAGLVPPQEEIDAEIEGVLFSLGMTEADLDQMLVENGTSLDGLRESIGEFLVRLDFITNVLLVDYPEEEWNARFDEWIANQQAAANIEINEDVLMETLFTP